MLELLLKVYRIIFFQRVIAPILLLEQHLKRLIEKPNSTLAQADFLRDFNTEDNMNAKRITVELAKVSTSFQPVLGWVNDG